MSESLIQKAAELMKEQATAYKRLNSICEQLVAALVRGAPDIIESITRTGEGELLGMRARLAQITSALTAFAAARAADPNRVSLGRQARADFESASKELISAARNFQKTQKRAAALAVNGMVFAGASIEMCGVRPTTYNAPYLRRGESKPWA